MRRDDFSRYLVFCFIFCSVRSYPTAENFESETPEDHWQLVAQVSCHHCAADEAQLSKAFFTPRKSRISGP